MTVTLIHTRDPNFTLTIQPSTNSDLKTLSIFLNSSYQGFSPETPDKKLEHCKELRFLQFPSEIIWRILHLLSIANLLKMRQTCTYHRTLIDGKLEVQARVFYHYLQAMQPKCNIPIDDLKASLINNKLLVEVNNNLCLWKLIHDSSPRAPQLTINWINHLIIKNGQPEELADLFTQLQKQNKELLTLFLSNCQVDSKAIEALQLLQTSGNQNVNPLVLYLSNLQSIDSELPVQLSIASPQVVIVSSEFSIEKLLTEKSDLPMMTELEEQLLNESFSGELILKQIEGLNPIIRAGIVSSIWHSRLAPAAKGPSISKIYIQQQVYSFISQNPHDITLKVAVNNILNKN